MARVLIVEDDDTVAEVVAAYLGAAGMDVHRSADGGEALTAAASLSPDLIVLDVMLPQVDGIEVLRRLRQRAIVAPVLMLTALGDEDDRIRGLEVGADDYLTKPFTNDELNAAVKAQLVKRHALADKYETTIRLLRKNIVYALPHELRTPLAVCLGFADLLRKDAESLSADQMRQMGEHIYTYTERLHRVLENFLIFAQIEVLAADPEQLEQARNHITEHVGQVVEARARSVADKVLRGADLSLDIHDFAAQIAENDLARMVEELVDNAFKFSPRGSTVTVRVARNDQNFHIDVSDQGRGMSPEQIEMVGAYMQFDRALFEQQGLGLGLIIARRLAEIHRGRLVIHSTIGIGTDVRLSFGSP